MDQTLKALEDGLPEITSLTKGKPSIRLFKPLTIQKSVSASWLEKEGELPSDLSTIIGKEPEKGSGRHFTSDHCALLEKQNREQGHDQG